MRLPLFLVVVEVLCKEQFYNANVEHHHLAYHTYSAQQSKKLYPVDCNHRVVFRAEEMSGVLKEADQLSRCKKVNYTFEIEPNPSYGIQLEMTSIRHIGQFLDIYYTAKDWKDMIFVNSIQEMYYDDTFFASEGIAFFINGTGSHAFKITFNRVRSNETVYKCPYPLLEANTTIQKLTTVGFPSAGCAFRIISKKLVRLFQKCRTSSWNATANLVGHPGTRRNIGKIEEYKFDVDLFLTFDASQSYYTWREIGCELTYFTLEKDPCDCGSSQFDLPLKAKVNISSPAYPNLLCPSLNCFYNFSTSQPRDSEITAWVISAFHMSRLTGDQLLFYVDGQERVRLNKKNVTLKEDLILIGDTFQVNYSATSEFAINHGFAMTVQAHQQPLVKRLQSAGAYTLVIGSHCRIMLCKMSIPAAYPEKKMFRMKIDYRFTRSGEYVDIDSGDNEQRIRAEDHWINKLQNFTEIIDWQTNSSINLVYHRENLSLLPVAQIEDTVITFRWEWLTGHACDCGKEIHEASPDTPLTLYSPRWPSHYCNNLTCNFLIQAPLGYHLKLNLSELATESHSDFLTIYDGVDLKEEPLEKFAGVLKVPFKMLTYTRNATVIFQTDSTITNKGFKLEYQAVKNKEVLISPDYSVLWILLFTTFCVIFIGVAFLVIYRRRIFTLRPTSTVENPMYGQQVEEAVLIDLKKEEL